MGGRGTATGVTSASRTLRGTSEPSTPSSRPGTKTEYVQYREAAGNVSPVEQDIGSRQ